MTHVVSSPQLSRAQSRWTMAFATIILLATAISVLSAQSTAVRKLGASVSSARLIVKAELETDARLALGWRSLFAAALSDRGEVAVAMHLKPGSLVALYAEDGSPRWSVSVPNARVESVAIVDDTVGYVERFEDLNFLVLLSRQDGMELDRRPISLSGFEQSRLLGAFKGDWYAQVSELAGEYKAARLPFRTVRRFDASSRSWSDVVTREDSSPRAIAPNGADALPPPFAPSPRFALSETKGLFFAAGNSWDVESVSANGTFTTHLRLQPIADELSESEWQKAVADWTANPPLAMYGYSKDLYTAAAALGRGTSGRMISTVFANSRGDLLVRRRDADFLSSSTPIPSVWDMISVESDTLYRVQLESDESIVAFAAPRSLLLRKLGAQGRASMRIVELKADTLLKPGPARPGR